MPSTTITGLSSGIEWSDTIDLMMQIESQPMERVLERQDEIKRKKTAWNVIRGKLDTLQSVSKDMDTREELLTKTATSNDNDKLSVEASSEAISSKHNVVINQLAEAEVEVHSTGWSDLGSTAVITGADGQFDYQYAGDTYSVTVPDGSTLADLVRLINDSNDNPGIVASTIDDGSGTNAIHLVLASKESGASNSVDILDSTNLGGTGTEFDSGSFIETQNAQDAEIRVDGFPTVGWITRDSNTIDDVITGVTLTLKDADLSGIEIQISDDTTQIKSQVNDWVESFNDVISDIGIFTRYDEETETPGILQGDGQLYSVRTSLQDIVAREIPDLPEDSPYPNLAAIGILVGAGGQLEIDDTKLQDALEDNLEAVVDLFVFTQSSTSADLTYFSRTEDTAGGTYDVEATFTAGGILDPSGTNTIGGYPATIENDTFLVGQEDTEVEGLRINFTDPGGGPGTVTSTVRVGTGAAVLSDNQISKLTDSIEGLFKIVTDSFDTQIEALDDQLLAWERRLEITRTQLEKKFMAMEMAVSQAQSQGSWLGAIG